MIRGRCSGNSRRPLNPAWPGWRIPHRASTCVRSLALFTRESFTMRRLGTISLRFFWISGVLAAVASGPPARADDRRDDPERLQPPGTRRGLGQGEHVRLGRGRGRPDPGPQGGGASDGAGPDRRGVRPAPGGDSPGALQPRRGREAPGDPQVSRLARPGPGAADHGRPPAEGRDRRASDRRGERPGDRRQ